jgi:hypothetical protein
MSALHPTAHVAVMVRDLQRNLPYTRLFGAHFVVDEDLAPFRRVRRRQRDLEPSTAAR